MKKRIIMTGGSGIAGKWVVNNLVSKGYELLNVDRTPLKDPPPRTRTLVTDLTDPGQVFNALSATTTGHVFDPSLKPQLADCVIHFGAVPRGMIIPDCQTFKNNLIAAFNVFDAAAKLGIKKVIYASSEAVYGIVFPDEYTDPVYLPLDEEYPCNPQDTYGTAKLMSEVLAKSYHERFGMDMYGLRIGNVVDDNDYLDFPGCFKDPGFKRRILWSYIDVRDLANAVELAVEKDGLGYITMNVAADDAASNIPTAELLKSFYPKVPLKHELSEFGSLLSNKKLKRVLGWKQQHNWRDHVKM